MWRRLTPLFLAPLLIASPVAARHADPLGDGWMRFEVAAAGRTLAAAMPSEVRADGALTIVIEGDGRAHDRQGRASANPTPERAIGLDLAQAWPGPAAWLGRPCQYVSDAACKPADWSSHRFSEAAVAMTDAAVSTLMSRAKAERVVLVGWSGGGVMAALVAARRNDVAGLVTIAAPLDVAAWTRSRGLSPLQGLDPADLAPIATPQLHLTGAFDPVVRPTVVRETARRLAGPMGQVETWSERHECCWAARIDEIAAGLPTQP
jgi:pimeloyl-ACP methyl ester carboxylesterase